MTYIVTVDDGSSVQDIKSVKDDEVCDLINRLLVDEAHDKVLARRVEEEE